MTGVGYHDKLQWAVYTAETGKFHHGELGSVPESERLAEGYGCLFSPFYSPRMPEEIRYCVKLADWWRAVQERRSAARKDVTVCGSGDLSRSVYRSSLREHRLIADADPQAPPNGYFDCTVEVGVTQGLFLSRSMLSNF